MTPQEAAEGAGDAIRERLDKFSRDHLSYKFLIVSQSTGDEVARALTDVEENGSIYLVAPTSEDNPDCVIVPWRRYTELLGIEHDLVVRKHARPEGD